jgi:hypothetical protein
MSIAKSVVFQKWRWPCLHRPSKGISIHKLANDDVVHLRRFREADGLSDQAFDPRPQGEMRALDFLGVAFAYGMLCGVEVTCVCAPLIRKVVREAEGFKQCFELEKDGILTPSKDIRQDCSRMMMLGSDKARSI